MQISEEMFMRFDEYGLPIEESATDRQDSARLAGLLVTFEWPQKIDLGLYLKSLSDDGGDTYSFYYVRHPAEYRYDLSRDQYVCLISGYYKQGYTNLVAREFVNGKDFMSPTIAGHEQRCKGFKSTLWQDAWLVADILAYAAECLIEIDEPNQLLCIVETAGRNWLRFFCAITPWKKALRKYWIETRDKPEVELVEHIIRYVESKI
jgi:hypothetical protein